MEDPPQIAGPLSRDRISSNVMYDGRKSQGISLPEHPEAAVNQKEKVKPVVQFRSKCIHHYKHSRMGLGTRSVILSNISIPSLLSLICRSSSAPRIWTADLKSKGDLSGSSDRDLVDCGREACHIAGRRTQLTWVCGCSPVPCANCAYDAVSLGSAVWFIGDEP